MQTVPKKINTFIVFTPYREHIRYYHKDLTEQDCSFILNYYLNNSSTFV